MDDIPPRVRNRPVFAALSPEDEQEFLRQQAGFEAAYRATGDPQALCHALLHVWSSRQTPPAWVVRDILNALIEQRTDEAAERYRERMRHVQRYLAVRDLRSKGHKKDDALDQAVEVLARQRAAAARGTIEDSYNRLPGWRRGPTRIFIPPTARFRLPLGILRPPHPRHGLCASRNADRALPPRPLPERSGLPGHPQNF